MNRSHTLLVALCLFAPCLVTVGACTLPANVEPLPPEGSTCAGAPYFEGEPQPATMLGVNSAAGFRFYEETGRASFEWGFQGGTMITPRIEVPAELADPGTCVRVTFENVPAPDSSLAVLPWEPVGDSTFTLDSTGRTVAINDQISWDDPTGMRFQLRATVQGPDFALTETVELEIEAPQPPEPNTCNSLLTDPGGCRYYAIPGTAVIETADGSSDGCPTATFELNDEAHRTCSSSRFPEGTMKVSDCPAGLEPGDRLDASLHLISEGTCSPESLHID